MEYTPVHEATEILKEDTRASQLKVNTQIRTALDTHLTLTLILTLTATSHIAHPNH